MKIKQLFYCFVSTPRLTHFFHYSINLFPRLLLLAHLDRVSLFTDLGGAEDLRTRWREGFVTFMISRPNLQYSDWMEFGMA